jgi:hypothetical protein
VPAFKVKITVVKLKRYKAPGVCQILAELIQGGSRRVCSETHKLYQCIGNEETLHQQWKDSVIIPVYKTSDETGCRNYQGVSWFQLHTKY